MTWEILTTKRLAAVLLVLLAAGGAALAVMLPGGAASRSSLPTATATRGDIVDTVGGVGRVVEGRSSVRISVLTASAAGAAATAPPNAVFATATGHLARFFVVPGQHVSAGQALAVLDDGGAAALAVDQTRSDLASARLELAQKRTSDPSKGVPPTPAELAAARLAERTARARLALLARPSAVDLTSARVDLRKARADLETLTRAPVPAAVATAARAVDVAAQRLAQISGPPTQVDVAAARLELAKAQAELDALKTAPPGPSSTAVEAAQLAVKLAQQRIAELPPTAPASDATAAQLDLKKAQADLEALQRAAPGPSSSALAAAQASVDLSTQKLALLTGPPNPLAVASAQLELDKARADLAVLRRGAGARAIDAARLAVTLAQRKLALLLHPPAAVRDAAQLDVAKAVADLGTLQGRGGPASRFDIALARLKVQVAAAHVSAAEAQAGRLTVRAPAGGTVTSLLAAPGSPTDSTTAIATVADLGHLAVSVDLSEFDAARVHRGEPALVSVDALGGKTLPGKVVFEALAGVDNGGVVSFPVRVALTRVAGVKPGMNVSVRIVVAQRRNVVRVPLEAVSGATVTVVDAAGRKSTRKVELGLADNKDVEIRRGLQPGEQVLMPGGNDG